MVHALSGGALCGDDTDFTFNAAVEHYNLIYLYNNALLAKDLTYS